MSNSPRPLTMTGYTTSSSRTTTSPWTATTTRYFTPSSSTTTTSPWTMTRTMVGMSTTSTTTTSGLTMTTTMVAMSTYSTAMSSSIMSATTTTTTAAAATTKTTTTSLTGSIVESAMTSMGTTATKTTRTLVGMSGSANTIMDVTSTSIVATTVSGAIMASISHEITTAKPSQDMTNSTQVSTTTGAFACKPPSFAGVQVFLSGELISGFDVSQQDAPMGLEQVNCSGLALGNTCRSICMTGYESAPAFACMAGGDFAALDPASLCQPASCASAPLVLFSEDLSSCIGQKHASLCEPKCKDGLRLNGNIVCDFGVWRVPGVCARSEAALRTVSAVYMSISLRGVGLSAPWANANIDALTDATAKMLQLDTSQILLSVRAERRRRLQLRWSQGLSIDRRLAVDALVLDVVVAPTDSGGDELTLKLEATQVSQRVNSSFVALVQATLADMALPEPVGLQGATAFIMTPPSNLSSFQLPTFGRWQSGPWGSCSNDCGSGTQTRQVVCTVGEASSCGTQPPSSQPCEADDCDESAICPLGKSELACKWQLVILIGLLCMCLLACWACALHHYVGKKPPTLARAGSIFIDELKARATYEIAREGVPASGVAPARSCDGSGPSPGMRRTVGTDGKQKIHVIWNTDEVGVKALYEMKEKIDEDQPQGEVFCGDQEAQAILEARVPEPPPPSAPPFIFETLKEVSLAYTVGDTVEYYSRRHQMWKPGSICAVFDEAREDSSSEQEILETYQVQVGMHGQMRDKVPLKLLRRVFVDGDPVEVVLVSESGHRTVQTGVVSGDQSAIAGIVGYRVQLSGGGTSRPARVSSGMLRARFPANHPVQLYMGATQGWIDAIVDPTSVSENGCGLEPIPLESNQEEAHHPEDSPALHSPRPEAPTELREAHVPPARLAAMDIAVWVPIRPVAAGSVLGPASRAPSFLVRSRSKVHGRGEIQV